MSLVNKSALLVFPHPNLLVLVQYSVAAVALSCASFFGVFSVKTLSMDKFQGVGVLALFFHLGIWSNSQVMHHGNVDTFIAFRGCVPLVVALLEQFLLPLKAKRINAESAISLSAIFVTSVGFGVADDKFNVLAYLWGVFATLTIAAESLWVKRLFDTNDFSFWEISLLNNSLSAVYAFCFEIARLFTGFASEFNDVVVSSASFAWPLFLSCCAGIAMSVSAFAVRKELSATSFSVLGVANKFLTIAFNSLAWAHHSSLKSRILLALGILATVTYQQSMAPPEPKMDKGQKAALTWTKASAIVIFTAALGVTASSIIYGESFVLPQELGGELKEAVGKYTPEDFQSFNSDFGSKTKSVTFIPEEDNANPGNVEKSVAKTDDAVPRNPAKKVLVILYGQIRGDAVMHKSIMSKVLDPWNADLALLAPISSDTPLVNEARYVWNVNDTDDWGTHMSDIKDSKRVWASACSKQVTKKVRQQVKKGWRIIAGPVYLGGVGKCAHTNSKQGLNIAFRHLAQKSIRENNLQALYEWFVFTRSDFLYLCNVPPLNSFSRSRVTIPHGQDYGGYNDRFHVIPSGLVLKALNLANDLVENWKTYAEHPCPNSLCNIEGAIRRHFIKEHIKVSRFNHPGALVHVKGSSLRYLVRADRNDRDSKYLQTKGYVVKYPDEIKHARKRCGRSVKFNI